MKSTMTCVLLLLAAGCQTRITATKNAETVHPIQSVVTVNGQEQIITTGYMVASGGWEATARSPLYATEALNGLNIGVSTNGTVSLALEGYNRDLSTNSVVMVREMFSGGAQLAIAIGEAYVKIAGGGAQASSATTAISSLYNTFVNSGGDPSKATVKTDGSSVSLSDGDRTATISADGQVSTN